MPNCLDQCYLYEESHSIAHLPPDEQIEIEEELKKLQNNEPFNPGVLNGIVDKKCLGEYWKDMNTLPSKCKHYERLFGSEPSSVEERLKRLERKKADKRHRLTIIITVLGIISATIFSYLNWIKPK